MRDLSVTRQGWEEIEQAEARLPSRVTAQQSFRQWLQLQAVFESQLRDTAALFGRERLAAMAALQARLLRLVEWQETHGSFGPVHPEPPTAPAGS